MLGEKIGGTSGKGYFAGRTTEPGRSPKMEMSFQGSGSILGADVKETGTYWRVVRPGRDTLRRGARSDDSQGRKNGHMD